MDVLKKAVIMNGEISLTVIESTEIVNKAIKYHDLTPLTAAVLGRTMTAALFAASFLKSDGDKLSVTVSGDGVGGHVIVSADGNLRVRGYIDNPRAELPLNKFGKLDVAGCVGKGKITIVRSTGLKDPYTGTSEIISGELAEDFAYYYAVSEQTPTAMALGVKVSGAGKCVGAGGVIVQTLPGASDESISACEKLLAGFKDISAKIQNLGANGVCEKYFSGAKFTDFYPKYECVCSDDYIKSIIISLGKAEADDIVKEFGKIEVDCQYCDKKYIYRQKDVDELFLKGKDA